MWRNDLQKSHKCESESETINFRARNFVNLMPSTKLEVHNVSHYRQTRRPPTATDNISRIFSGIWPVVFEICESIDKQTDRHTDKLITIPGTTAGDEVIICEKVISPHRKRVTTLVIYLLNSNISVCR